MKKILLANIGNRNLHIESSTGYFVTIDKFVIENRLTKYLEVNERNLTEKVMFRNFTEDLWHSLTEQENDLNLQLEILTKNVIEKEGYCKVVIFFTSQDDEKFRHQDTVFEACIIKHLLNAEVPSLEVELILIAGNPTNQSNLFEQYASAAKLLINANPSTSFTYLDAGGTSQMKFATSTIFNYFLKQNHLTFQISYLSYLEDYTQDVVRTLSDRYYALDLASEFIAAYNFDAAYNALSRLNNKPTNISNILTHIEIAGGRLAFHDRKRWHPLLNSDVGLSQWANDYIRKTAPKGFLNFPEFSAAVKAEVFEFASICQHYFQVGNLTLGVASYYRLCEELGKVYSEKVILATLDNDTNRQHFASHNQHVVGGLLPEYGSRKFGVPFLIAFGIGYSISKKSPVQNLFERIRPTISHVNAAQSNKGINMLRNRCWLAHNSLSIENKDIETEVPGFRDRHLPQIFKAMGMPKENVFNEMRSDLLNMFKI